MSAGFGIALTVALLLLNGFFVAAEFALVSVRRASVEPRAEAGSRRAVITLRAVERVSLMMAGAQLGITLCSVALGAVSEPVIAHLLEPAFAGLGLPDSTVHPVAFVIALLLITVLHVVIGEMVPKNVALAGPDVAAQWLTPPLVSVVAALKPVIWALNQLANLVLRAVGVTPKEEVASAFTRDEVALLVDESRRGGLLAAGEHQLLGGALAFDTATVAALMLPMARVHTLPARPVPPSPQAVEQLAAATGVTRFPLRAGTLLLGYVHLKDTLQLPPAQDQDPLPTRYIRALPQVAADAPLTDAIEVMRAAHAHIAAVRAPAAQPAAQPAVQPTAQPAAAGAVAGPAIGLITLDDILASLVRPPRAAAS